MSQTTHLGKFSTPDHKETIDVCLEMFGCLQAERTIAIRKRKFFKKFCVIHNALCRVFVAIARGRLKTQVRKTKVPEDGICKYGIRKYEYATVENVSTAT